nr:putative endonuclease III protein [Ipomoea batatas]
MGNASETHLRNASLVFANADLSPESANPVTGNCRGYIQISDEHGQLVVRDLNLHGAVIPFNDKFDLNRKCLMSPAVGSPESRTPMKDPHLRNANTDLNNSPEKGDEWGTVRNVTDSNTSSPQPPRKYGEWMLVTRKSVAQDRNKVSKQPTQKTAHQSHKVNPFGPLQHANDEGGESLPPTSGRTTVEQTRRNKGKDDAPNGRLKGTASRVSPQGTRTDRQQTKGKAKAKNSNHHNTSETSVPTMSQQPPSVPSNSNKVVTHERSVPTSTTSLSPRPSQQVRRRVVQPSRGRGASRGGGHGGRGHDLNYCIDEIWMEKYSNGGVFQFGNTPPGFFVPGSDYVCR